MHFEKKTLKNIFIGVACCIVLYWILHETEQVKRVYKFLSGIFAPFVLGAGIAFIINVPMRSIESRFVKIKNNGLRRAAALVLTLLAFTLVLALVFYLLIPQVVTTAETFATKLPGFFTNVQKMVIDFLDDNPDLLSWVNQHVDLSNINFGAIMQNVWNVASNSFSVIVSGAVSAIGGIGSFFVNAVLGLVFAVYCLCNKEVLARQGRKILYAYLPENASDNIVRVLRLTNNTFSNFLSGQCLEVCILGGMFAIGMAIFRMPYIPLVSVLVAVTAFIPIVGAFVGCIFGAFFILVDNPIQAVGFVILFLVIQQIEGNLIYPRVVGDSIGLPGMWVLVAVAVGGELMGIAGMFLMIPLASVIYVLLGEITNARLKNRKIDGEKLTPQPPEIVSHLKKGKERRKLKREQRKSKQTENNEEE